MKKYIILFLILSTMISGCSDIKIKTTTLEVVDNNRYYYPILQGQELDIVFAIKNTGDVPFILSDIFTSCGCLIVDESSIEVISPKKEGKLILKYDSNKNVGNVEHYITLYGNTRTSDKTEIFFNIHVIPDALYPKDYEELYQEKKKLNHKKEPVDNNNQGYYMNGDF